MKEAYYQKKIMEGIERMGGVVVNGTYTKAGEADLQVGYPVDGELKHLAIEVKSSLSYSVMSNNLEIVDGLYRVKDKKKFDKRENLQIVKINRNRELGGKALIAFSLAQVKAYMGGKGEDITTPKK